MNNQQTRALVRIRERGRVEALMREHTNPVEDSLNFTCGKTSRRPSSPGLTLVR
jgi:hypothetical protein